MPVLFGKAASSKMSRRLPNPSTSRGPRNPIPIYYRTTGGTGLSGTIKSFLATGKSSGACPATPIAQPTSLPGDPAQGPACRQPGEEAGASAPGLALLDQTSSQPAHPSDRK